MIENAFLEKGIEPDEAQIRQKLKSAYPILLEIRKRTKNIAGETIEEWKYYGAKNGWVLKTFFKKRNLYFLSFYDNYFKISFVFGEKAVSKILESGVSESLRKELSQARKYAEGRGLSIIVRDNSYIDDIRKLIKFKVEI